MPVDQKLVCVRPSMNAEAKTQPALPELDNSAADQAELTANQLAPTNDLESAMIVTLPTDAFTAIVAGKDGATGVGLVEVYRIP